MTNFNVGNTVRILADKSYVGKNNYHGVGTIMRIEPDACYPYYVQTLKTKEVYVFKQYEMKKIKYVRLID